LVASDCLCRIIAFRDDESMLLDPFSNRSYTFRAMTSSRWCAIKADMRRTGEMADVGRKELIRVVLAEDHAEFRMGLKEMLATDGDIEIVGEAENGARAVALAKETRPDVVVLDLVMPVMEGAEALGLILQEGSPSPGVVILTMHDQPSLRRELMGMGASAFLAKSASLAEVIGAVKGACPLRKPREDSGAPSAT
jgi:CheY-like chemotaxis protein